MRVFSMRGISCSRFIYHFLVAGRAQDGIYVLT